MMRKYKLKHSELKGIKNKPEQYAKVGGGNGICEFEYFEKIKEFNFLLAKSYHMGCLWRRPVKGTSVVCREIS